MSRSLRVYTSPRFDESTSLHLQGSTNLRIHVSTSPRIQISTSPRIHVPKTVLFHKFTSLCLYISTYQSLHVFTSLHIYILKTLRIYVSKYIRVHVTTYYRFHVSTSHVILNIKLFLDFGRVEFWLYLKKQTGIIFPNIVNKTFWISVELKNISRFIQCSSKTVKKQLNNLNCFFISCWST